MVQDPQTDAAMRAGSAAAELLKSLEDLPERTDVYALLETLGATQKLLAEAYDRLAGVQERAARTTMREELRNEDEPVNRSWLAADVALREAARLARSSAESIMEAHRLNGIARWQSDITADL